MKQYQEIQPHNQIPWTYLAKLRYFPQIDKLVVCENNKDKTVKVYKSEVTKWVLDSLIAM